jgi:acetate kinase
MSGAILTLNAGSSSLKFAVHETDLTVVMTGEIGGIGATPHLVVHDGHDALLADRDVQGQTTLAALLCTVLDISGERSGRALAGVGHRVVMGGAEHVHPARITQALRADLHRLVPLAPLHMPASLAAIDAITQDRPDLAQVACFDTAFHATQPDLATRFALPRAVSEAGVRRYGFHGLSYEHIAVTLADIAPHLAKGRVIAAHLGAGASLCALHNSRSIATTMGFTALDGLMMATRCGSLDAGVVLYLAQQGHSHADIEDMLYRRSGLLGVSGISGDVRTLEASADPHAAEALALFTYRIAIEAGGLVSALGGLDGLVFTAGIGEHAPTIRAAVCERLAWLGLVLDPQANAAGATVISSPGSAIEVRVIPANEERMIALHTRRILSGDKT